MADSYDYSMETIARILIREAGLKTGRYALSLEFNLSAGVVRLGEDGPMPGGIIAVSKISLVQAEKAPPDSPMVFDVETVLGTKADTTSRGSARKRRPKPPTVDQLKGN